MELGAYPHTRLELARPRPPRRGRARGVDGMASTSCSCRVCGRLHPRRTPATRCPSGTPAASAAETAGNAVLLPAYTRHGQHSPVRRYPWDEAYLALRRLMARSPGRDTLTSLDTATCSTAALPGHPGLPAPGPARRRPDPAAPGNRKLGHRGSPRHRDAHLRRPYLPAPSQRRGRHPRLDLASADRERGRAGPTPAHRPPHPRRFRPVPGRGRTDRHAEQDQRQRHRTGIRAAERCRGTCSSSSTGAAAGVELLHLSLALGQPLPAAQPSPAGPLTAAY